MHPHQASRGFTLGLRWLFSTTESIDIVELIETVGRVRGSLVDQRVGVKALFCTSREMASVMLAHLHGWKREEVTLQPPIASPS